jgi:hypothetical protein
MSARRNTQLSEHRGKYTGNRSIDRSSNHPINQSVNINQSINQKQTRMSECVLLNGMNEEKLKWLNDVKE